MVSHARYPHPADWLSGRLLRFPQAAALALTAALLLALGGYAPLVICALFILSPLRRTVWALSHHRGRRVRTKSIHRNTEHR